uniref:Ribosomal protein S16 n=1 Tax=Juncus effusus TaxID=13579 RepID=A0A8A3SPM2_JUNEF|nr:ribosomal protein S16 [Juncus effusus]QSZ78379.1 ribosomal protein S16 [Juncus effusus]
MIFSLVSSFVLRSPDQPKQDNINEDIARNPLGYIRAIKDFRIFMRLKRCGTK